MKSSATIPKRITDKNGKPTTVYVNPDKGATSTARKLPAIPPVPSVTQDVQWQDRPVIVMGQKRKLGEVVGGRIFHGSPHKIEVGEYITPQDRDNRNFSQSSEDSISFTSDATRAALWAREAASETTGSVYLYEIEPEGDVESHRVQLANAGQNIIVWEARASRGKIVGVHEVSRAKGPVEL